ACAGDDWSHRGHSRDGGAGAAARGDRAPTVHVARRLPDTAPTRRAMSSALAIAGVTAVLRDLLNDGLINHNISGVLGSTVTVSTLPPDRVVPANGTENTQLNLFLHQV